MPKLVDPQKYYRLPWTLTDNAISWLEVTTACNLDCAGCYRDTKSPDGHKTLAEIADDLAVFKRERKSDCISIAGGDPLVHPQIVEIVRMIKAGGWKPICNTNGLALTPKLLKELVRAGIYGFTFHIDTSQKRKDATGASTEADYNPLRQRLAEMLAEEGLACSFNQTVTRDTLDQVPETLLWAEANPDIVHTVVFILYREPRYFGDGFDYYAGDKKIEISDHYKRPDEWGGSQEIKAPAVVAKIREVDPDYEPCAYLGGSVDPESTKWLLATRIANKKRGFGYVSPKYMELVQQTHHLFTGTWLAYADPVTNSRGRESAFAMAPFDPKMRKIARRFLENGLRHPRELLEKAFVQAVLIIQPIDLLADGRPDMCDGCPDMTVHEGKLYWSCRLEEIKEYGAFVRAVPNADKVKPRRRPAQRVSPS